jgi:hypothetical protein
MNSETGLECGESYYQHTVEEVVVCIGQLLQSTAWLCNSALAA